MCKCVTFTNATKDFQEIQQHLFCKKKITFIISNNALSPFVDKLKWVHGPCLFFRGNLYHILENTVCLYTGNTYQSRKEWMTISFSWLVSCLTNFVFNSRSLWKNYKYNIQDWMLKNRMMKRIENHSRFYLGPRLCSNHGFRLFLNW